MASTPTNPTDNAASIRPPDDNQIAYTTNGMPGKPAFPGPEKPLPGHAQVDPRIAQREAAARHNAATAQATAKSDAQRRRSLTDAPAQHSSTGAIFTSVSRPRRGR